MRKSFVVGLLPLLLAAVILAGSLPVLASRRRGRWLPA